MTACFDDINFTHSPLSLEEFNKSFEKKIREEIALPKKFLTIQNYIHDLLGRRFPLTPRRKIEMLEKTHLSKFEAERTRLIQSAVFKCFLLFSSASRKTSDSIPMIIGDRSLANNEDMLRNFGIVCSRTPRLSAKFSHLLPITTVGGINCEGSLSSIKKDLFILGGVHQRKPFYVFYYTKIKTDKLWDDKHNMPSLLCREISILLLCGYKTVFHPSLGIAFEPPTLDPKKQEMIDYDRLIASLQDILSEKEIAIQFLQLHSIPICR